MSAVVGVEQDHAPSRIPQCRPQGWASASTLDPFRALATLDPVREICGISGVESRFNKRMDSGLVP